jgi:methionyl-tRNA formyltransferase
MTQKLKTCFFGTPEFSLPTLRVVHENTELLAVITQPDKARGRKQQVLPCDVKKLALELGHTVYSPSSLKKESDELKSLLNFFEKVKPDIFVVVAYGNLLPQKILDIPKFASINVHASLLPKWRGAAPIQRALEARDKETGVSLQKMIMELDAGEVFSETRIPIENSAKASTLSVCLSELGANLVKDFIHKLSTSGQLPPSLPQDPKNVSFAQKITKEEGFWDSSWTQNQSLGRIAAFEVWPGVRACVSLENYEKSPHLPDFIIMNEAEIDTSNRRIRPGELIVEDKKVFLGCSDGSIQLKKVQIPASKVSPAFIIFQNLLSKTGQKSLKVTKFSIK